MPGKVGMDGMSASRRSRLTQYHAGRRTATRGGTRPQHALSRRAADITEELLKTRRWCRGRWNDVDGGEG